MSLLRRKQSAQTADRHDLYQRSVQDAEAEIDFIEEVWNELRSRPPEFLREDFCGTANVACEWVRRGSNRYAVGVDLDSEVLEWGRENNVNTLSAKARQRLELVEEDVREVQLEPADIVIAMNFSYYLFKTRAGLREYFSRVLAGLAPDGLFCLDAFGGYDAARELEEPREVDGFTYIWDQATFNPIDSGITCHIHFEFPDGSRMDKAFSYDWRLWTLPEIREILLEAGFQKVDIHWEGTDEETNEGNGVFEITEVGDADAGWVCYITAQP